jgi:very-short-patch-repair endonuclease
VSTAERNPRDTEARIRRRFLRQLGLITTAQARQDGMSASAITRRAGAGRWLLAHPGVYRDALVPETFEQSNLAALLWAGTDAVINVDAAGALWAFDGLVPSRIHLWTPRSLKSELVVVHRGTVDLNDRRMLGPIVLTSPARTLIDLAGVLDDEDLTAVVEDALHRGLTTAPAIGRRLDALGGKGRAGSARLREILVDRGNQRPTMSRLEVKIWRTLRAKGLTPVRQHPVRCGGTTYYLDCAFPQWRVAVEGFGDKFHRSPRNRKRELRRFADLASMQWRVLPVTWDDITDAPDDVVMKIMTMLAA